MHSGYASTLQEHSDSNVEEIDEEGSASSEDEKTPLLELPEPSLPPPPPIPEGWPRTLRRWGERVPARLPRAIWVRTLKSSVLVAKVRPSASHAPVLLRLTAVCCLCVFVRPCRRRCAILPGRCSPSRACALGRSRSPS